MAIVVGVMVAVAGWLVNERFARRAARRNMRIEYLLSAFRRLEYASNRRMSAAHRAAVEEAVSDIQLLGSPKQVQMAIDFARSFAADQRADTEPLLLDLRATLRGELELEPVPAERVWLRIDGSDGPQQGPSAGHGAMALWEAQSVEVQTSIRATSRPGPHDVGSPTASSDGLTPFAVEMLAVSERSSPIGAVVACEQQLAAMLRQTLTEHSIEEGSAATSAADLALIAHRAGLIGDSALDGVRGLEVMHSMALLEDGGRRLTDRQVREFIALTDGLMYAIRTGGTPIADP